MTALNSLVKLSPWVAAVLLLASQICVAGADNSTTQPATTEPTMTSLEQQFIFPGSFRQGTPGARIIPPSGAELLTLRAADGTSIAGLYGAAIHPRDAHPPTILCFYGNGASVATSTGTLTALRNLGYNAMLVDYEGYGMSGGRPGEAGCYAAADAGYDYLLSRKEIDSNRIVAMGHSLGGAIAIDLASRRHVAGLITFSTFTNIAEMAKPILAQFPVSIPITTRFDSLSKIPKITCPIFMAHGSQDHIVPASMLDALVAVAKVPVTRVLIPGASHSDVFQHDAKLFSGQFKEFIDHCGG